MPYIWGRGLRTCTRPHVSQERYPTKGTMYLPRSTSTKLVYHFLGLNGPLTDANTELYEQHYRTYREHVHHATNPHKTAATSLENALSTGDPLRIAAALCVADTPLLTPAEYQHDRPLTPPARPGILESHQRKEPQ